HALDHVQIGTAEPLVQQLSGRTVLVHLTDRLVDRLAGPHIAVGKPHPVLLLGERVVHEAERGRILGEEAREDQVVGGDRVDPPLTQPFDALAVAGRIHQGHVDTEAVGDPCGGVGALAPAHVEPLQVAYPFDARGIGTDEDVLLGDVVGTTERHLGLALGRDGVGGGDHVHLAVQDPVLPFGRGDTRELHLLLLETHLLGDVRGHVHVETDQCVVLLQPRAGLVVLDPDGQRLPVEYRLLLDHRARGQQQYRGSYRRTGHTAVSTPHRSCPCLACTGTRPVGDAHHEPNGRARRPCPRAATTSTGTTWHPRVRHHFGTPPRADR